MEKYISLNAIVAEIKRRISEVSQLEKASYEVGLFDAYKNILSFLNTLEVKEVEEETESIWHDANQQPTMYRKYLVRYSDGRVSGSWERHDSGFIPWEDVIKEHGFTHWCYVEDLIKL